MKFTDFNSEAELRNHWNQLWVEKEKKEGCYDSNNPPRMPSDEQQSINELVTQWKKAYAAVEAYNALPANLDKDTMLSKWCDAKSEINTYNQMNMALITDWRRQVKEILETEYEMGLFASENGGPTDNFAGVYDKAINSDLDAEDNLDDGYNYGMDGFDPQHFNWKYDGGEDTADDFSADDEKYDDLADFFDKVDETTDNFSSDGMNSASNESDDLQYDDLSDFNFGAEGTKKVSPDDEDTEMDEYRLFDTKGINDNISDRNETSSASAEKNKKLTAEDANYMHADLLSLIEKKNHTLRKGALLAKGKDEGVSCFFKHNEIRSADGSFTMEDIIQKIITGFYDIPAGTQIEIPESKKPRVEALAIRDANGKKINTTLEELSSLVKDCYSSRKPGKNGTFTPCVLLTFLCKGEPENPDKTSKELVKSVGAAQNRPRKVHGVEQPGLPGAVCAAFKIALPATVEAKAENKDEYIDLMVQLWVPRKPILDKNRNLIGLEKRSYGFDYDTTTEKGQRVFEGYCHGMKEICKNVLLKSVAAIRKMPLLGTGTIAAAKNYKDTLNYQVKRKLNQSSREVSKALFKFDTTHEDCKDEDYIKCVNKITMNARYRIIDIVRGIDFMDGFRKISEYLDDEYNRLIDSALKKSEDLATKYNVQKLQTAAS